MSRALVLNWFMNTIMGFLELSTDEVMSKVSFAQQTERGDFPAGSLSEVEPGTEVGAGSRV